MKYLQANKDKTYLELSELKFKVGSNLNRIIFKRMEWEVAYIVIEKRLNNELVRQLDLNYFRKLTDDL